MPSIASYNKRLEGLRTERNTFRYLWRELSDYHLAHRGRFLTTDRNEAHRSYRRNTKMINNSSRIASRVLASGMMSGITSPARPWFRLGSGDQELNEFAPVKQWLHDVERLMYRVFSSSNVYNSLHTLYSELGVFGTAAMGVYHDFDNVIWTRPYTAGSYLLDINGKNEVDTFIREYELSVGQVVKEFGFENCSIATQNLWRSGHLQGDVQIVHLIEPNDNRDRQSPLANNMPYRSVYYERDTQDRDKFLRQSGFEDFPILAPRWDVVGEDIYATDCPGMTTLGDTKALQLMEKQSYKAVDKLVNPPLQAPSSMKSAIKGQSLGPNELIYTNDQVGIRSVYDFRPDLNAIELKITQAENRINTGWYRDLFLMLAAQPTRSQVTATEIAERQEEKLLQLGPVLERLHSELLDPLIDRTFNILQNAGALPPAPDELAGRELNVEYVSVLAQAQRMVSISSIEQLSAFTAGVSNVWPNARFKFDAEQAIDDYAESLGVNPRIVRSDDEVDVLVQQEQQELAQQQAMAQAEQMAQVAKTASEGDLSGDNVLSRAAEAAQQ